MSDSQASSQPDELTTIREILAALERFDKPAHKRILDYIYSRLDLPTPSPQPAQVANSQPQYTAPRQANCEFVNLAELINTTGATKQSQKALVAAYWIQECEGQSQGFGSGEIKEVLVHAGHKIANATASLKELTKGAEASILQDGKRGKGKNAPIIFKISAAGKKAVEEMINQQG